jgi:hypothetical protein
VLASVASFVQDAGFAPLTAPVGVLLVALPPHGSFDLISLRNDGVLTGTGVAAAPMDLVTCFLPTKTAIPPFRLFALLGFGSRDNDDEAVGFKVLFKFLL